MTEFNIPNRGERKSFLKGRRPSDYSYDDFKDVIEPANKPQDIINHDAIAENHELKILNENLQADETQTSSKGSIFGSTTNNESSFNPERATNYDSAPKKERALNNGTSSNFETPSKMKAPKNLSFNLNSIERARASLDSLRIEQIVKDVSNATQSKEVVIGRKVFEQNGVNKARFVQSREETRDRGVIDFEIRKGKNGEETWYWLK